MSTRDSGTIYLGKGGRIFGPYPAEKLDALRLTGEILNYTYLWDEGAGEWRNIDPEPPKPGSTSTRRKGDSSLETADAICHDFNALVAGRLQNVTDIGCELVSHDPADAPLLALNSALVLNIMDPKGEKAANIRAAVFEVTHSDGAWIYHLRWEHRPSF